LKHLLPRGFTLEDHTIVLTGRCDRCSPAPQRSRLTPASR
jgi:Fe2+ or Zn2+ uptake regulation protein